MSGSETPTSPTAPISKAPPSPAPPISKAPASPGSPISKAPLSPTPPISKTPPSAFDADFGGARFSGPADFGNAAFSRRADFGNAAFSRRADFQSAAFKRNADFGSARFFGPALFRAQTFTNDAFFNGAKFEPGSAADFSLVTFERVVQFDDASFEGEADFNAVWGKRTFSLARARFKGVPNFIQAHFEEAPRLDNVVAEGRLLEPQEEAPEGEKLPRRKRLHRWLQGRSAPYRQAHYIRRRVTSGIAQGSALRDMPARWRALKRLAIEGHDTERELHFFSGEIRSQRFAEHWPLPWPVWKFKPWGGALGFLAGLLYQTFSNFGRSVVRPLFFWALCIAIFSVYFLGQNPDIAAARRQLNHQGFFRQVAVYSTVAWKAATGKLPAACVTKTLPTGDFEKDKENGFTGLAEPVRHWINPINEALSIAYHNAAIILDLSGDSAHRAFGCLYGVERYGGNPVAFVPRSVAIASGIQKLLSAIFIFLFGLAVRNMLKMK